MLEKRLIEFALLNYSPVDSESIIKRFVEYNKEVIN